MSDASDPNRPSVSVDEWKRRVAEIVKTTKLADLRRESTPVVSVEDVVK